MSEIKVLLLCSSTFAIPVLQQLAFLNQLTLVGIPAHSVEMKERVEVILSGMEIPVLILEKKTFVQQLVNAKKEISFNLGLSATFSYKIPSEILELPEKGFYNLHPGPLPAYRGPDPVFYQIKNRETQAGVALHKLDAGWDTGPVFLQKNIKLNLTDSYGQLNAKLGQKAANLTEVLLKLASYNLSIPLKFQDEATATYYPKQQAKDVTINWQTMDADDINALVNAGNPWNKGAITKINNQIVRIVQGTSIYNNRHSKGAGCILSFNEDGMHVSTIKNQVICVTILFTDEGFFSAGFMSLSGMFEGQFFESV